jgi:hypothetical protein
VLSDRVMLVSVKIPHSNPLCCLGAALRRPSESIVSSSHLRVDLSAHGRHPYINIVCRYN